MSKATQDEKRVANRDNYVEQVFMLSGLPGWPFEDLGKTALVDTLMRETANLHHAKRVIAKALVSMFPRAGGIPQSVCPTPLELMNLCRATSADGKVLPDGCGRCVGWGGKRLDWVEAPGGGVERCSCDRGRRLAELDGARKAEARR